MIVAVEVVAKLGDSIIEVARVERGGSYSCPLVPFPLVCGEPTGFVVHRPVGVSAWRSGVPIAETHALIGASDMIVIALGKLALYVLPIVERAAPVPKRRLELRPFVYGAVVLLAHLLVWGVAEARFVEPLEKLPAPLPQMRVHVTHVEEPPAPVAPPRVDAPAARGAGAPAKGRAKKRGRGATSGESATLGAFGDVSMLIPSVDVVAMVNDSVAYDEQAAEDAHWGGSSGHFDPFRECTSNCGTIASAPYETLSFQNRPRPIPLVSIASDNERVKAALLTARSSLVACYNDRALDGDTGTVRAELQASSSGAFSLLYSRGLDGVGPCVATVIDALHLTGSSNATASITIAFTLQMR